MNHLSHANQASNLGKAVELGALLHYSHRYDGQRFLVVNILGASGNLSATIPEANQPGDCTKKACIACLPESRLLEAKVIATLGARGAALHGG